MKEAGSEPLGRYRPTLRIIPGTVASAFALDLAEHHHHSPKTPPLLLQCPLISAMRLRFHLCRRLSSILPPPPRPPLFDSKLTVAATLSRNFSTSVSRTMATLQRSAFIDAIEKHNPDQTAVIHSLSGRSFNYSCLLRDVSLKRQKLLKDAGKEEGSIAGERVAFLAENGYDYVGATL